MLSEVEPVEPEGAVEPEVPEVEVPEVEVPEVEVPEVEVPEVEVPEVEVPEVEVPEVEVPEVEVPTAEAGGDPEVKEDALPAHPAVMPRRTEHSTTVLVLSVSFTSLHAIRRPPPQ
jgi:hypothetical protein